MKADSIVTDFKKKNWLFRNSPASDLGPMVFHNVVVRGRIRYRSALRGFTTGAFR